MTGEKFDQKSCVGEHKSYNNPFMISILCFENSYEIEVLIYKPRVYACAIGIGGSWWEVSDFLEVTTYRSLINATPFPFSSRYEVSGCPTHFSYFVFRNSIINLDSFRDKNAFHNDLHELYKVHIIRRQALILCSENKSIN